jgi:hypothetical protein
MQRHREWERWDQPQMCVMFRIQTSVVCALLICWSLRFLPFPSSSLLKILEIVISISHSAKMLSETNLSAHFLNFLFSFTLFQFQVWLAQSILKASILKLLLQLPTDGQKFYIYLRFWQIDVSCDAWQKKESKLRSCSFIIIVFIFLTAKLHLIHDSTAISIEIIIRVALTCWVKDKMME